MLEHLSLKNIGPAPEMEMHLSPRLNLITGDNGLGKTFLLDIAWWALTHTWAQGIVRPNTATGDAAISYTDIRGGETNTLEKILPAVPETKYPLCLDGKRACPPEDCGSVPGYMQLVKVLKKSEHPEYEELRTWVGRKYDPELFDVEQFNKNLRLLKRYL